MLYSGRWALGYDQGFIFKEKIISGRPSPGVLIKQWGYIYFFSFLFAEQLTRSFRFMCAEILGHCMQYFFLAVHRQ